MDRRAQASGHVFGIPRSLTIVHAGSSALLSVEPRIRYAWGWSMGSPAAFQPLSPSTMTLTSVYPASTARRAAAWDASQWMFAQ
jgi:hypothetical protein